MSKDYTIGEAVGTLLRDGMPLRFTAYDGSSAGPEDAQYGLNLLNERGTVVPHDRARRPRPGAGVRRGRPGPASASTRATRTRRSAC